MPAPVLVLVVHRPKAILLPRPVAAKRSNGQFSADGLPRKTIFWVTFVYSLPPPEIRDED
jgi:hypothetical protein